MLRYAYFVDIKGGPKLLFWGEGVDMGRLSATLQETAKGKGASRFSELDWALSRDGSSIAIVMGDHAAGLRRRADTLEFTWHLDRETAGEFSEKVGALARVGPAGHQYLQCGTSDEITVMVSRSEYRADLAP